MSDFTTVLAYAGWVAAPMIAYQALMHGLRRAFTDFLLIYALYAGAVSMTFLALRTKSSWETFGVVSPLSVMIVLGGTTMLSGLLFWLGWTTDKEHD